MAKQFNSVADFVRYLSVSAPVHMTMNSIEGMKESTKLVQKTAKSQIGHYQSQEGPFSAWPQLAESTEIEKASKGYDLDSPLFATGDMKESIERDHEVTPAARRVKGYVGSASKIALYQEVGTSKMPARSFLGSALYKKQYIVADILSSAVISGITGENVFRVINKVTRRSSDGA